MENELQEKIKKIGCLVMLQDKSRIIRYKLASTFQESIDDTKGLIAKYNNAQATSKLVEQIAYLELLIEELNAIIEACIDSGLFSHESLESYMIEIQKNQTEK